jgi:hypothetical protein
VTNTRRRNQRFAVKQQRRGIASPGRNPSSCQIFFSFRPPLRPTICRLPGAKADGDRFIRFGSANHRRPQRQTPSPSGSVSGWRSATQHIFASDRVDIHPPQPLLITTDLKIAKAQRRGIFPRQRDFARYAPASRATASAHLPGQPAT